MTALGQQQALAQGRVLARAGLNSQNITGFHSPPDLWDDLGPAWYLFRVHARQRFLGRLQGPSILVTHGITAKVLRGLWLNLGYRDSVLLPGGQGCVFHLSNRQETCVWE